MKKFFVVAALIPCSSLMAQQAADSSKQLSEVVVSATKAPLKATSTGKVIVTINRADIERAGARDLTQVLSTDGGVFLNGAWSSPGKDKNLYLRGARVEHTLITIDGVPVYDPSGIGSNFDLRLIPIERVERIEILKGSQSTLYGSDAIAGVINIITRKAGTESVQGGALLSYGSFNTLRAAANAGGRSGKLDWNLGVSHFDTKGFSEAANPEGVDTFAANRFRQQGADVAVGYQVTEGLHLQPYFRYTKVSGLIDAGYYSDSRDYSTSTENIQAGLRGDLKLGQGTLRLLLNHNSTYRHYEDDSTLTENLWDTYNYGKYKAREFYAESYYALNTGQFKFTFGADYRRAVMSQENFSLPAWSGNPKSELGRDSVYHSQIAPYANVLWNGTKGLSIEAGGRYTNHSAYGNNFTWNVNPTYLWNNSVKLFANISTGFRTPSLYQLFSEYGNAALKPERSLNYEGGLQLLSDNGNAYLRATYFDREVKNLIVFYTDPATYESMYINRDKQKDHGIELDAKVQFNEHFMAKAFYSYADGTVTTKLGDRDTALFNLYRRPKEAYSMTLGATFGRFQASAQLYAVGAVPDQYFDRNSFRTVTVTLKSYATLNLYAEYALKRPALRFFADLRNVTGAQYQEVYGYATPGFNLYGGVRYSF
jgi:vitamin B12 transporter